MKKRTAKPFYGKQEQRMEALAPRAFEAGDRGFGELLVKTIRNSVDEKRTAHRSRQPAPWIPNKKGTRFQDGVRIQRGAA